MCSFEIPVTHLREGVFDDASMHPRHDGLGPALDTPSVVVVQLAVAERLEDLAGVDVLEEVVERLDHRLQAVQRQGSVCLDRQGPQLHFTTRTQHSYETFQFSRGKKKERRGLCAQFCTDGDNS